MLLCFFRLECFNTKFVFHSRKRNSLLNLDHFGVVLIGDQLNCATTTASDIFVFCKLSQSVVSKIVLQNQVIADLSRIRTRTVRVECRHATYLTTTTTRAPDIFTYLFLYACQLQQEKFCSIGPLTTSARTRNFYAYYGYHYLGLHRPRCSLATLYHERVEVPRRKQIGWKC